MIVIPDEDFILFVGTSHTYGSCTQEPNKKGRLQLDERYTTLIGKELGMKVLALGYPGIDNLGLLQVVNELLKLEVFTENCKMFILEPRVDSMKNDRWYNTSKANTFGGWQAEFDERNSVLEKIFSLEGNPNVKGGGIQMKDIPLDIIEYRLAFESAS